MIIGIDIGVTGAIALLDETGALMSVTDMPASILAPKAGAK
jgi:predicted RNase H-like nuclease (RuvC/YqgF family)